MKEGYFGKRHTPGCLVRKETVLGSGHPLVCSTLSLSLSQKNQSEVSRFLLRFDTYAVKVGTQRTHKVGPYLLYFSFKQCNIAWLESANFKVLTRGALIM